MQHEPVSHHMVRLGMVRDGGAAMRAIAAGAAPRLRQVGLALLRSDLRRARRALDEAHRRGSGWYDWRHLPPHVVDLARARAQRLGLSSTLAAVQGVDDDDGPLWRSVGRFQA